MNDQLIIDEINKQKEISVFYDMLRNLPKARKRTDKKPAEKIPVILSSDDNYTAFVATTGASILYNTQSFIEFYIISEGISDKNKKLIKESFQNITNNFSLKFAECDSSKEFSNVKLPATYHVKPSTCNRLLVPRLFPGLKRAVYLDVDLIAMGDIAEIWHEDLGGHIFGAVPLLIDRFNVVQGFLSKAKIPADKKFQYMNSGVMLIDYEKWRSVKGGNENIIKDIYSVLNYIGVVNTVPDELILNRFAYTNGGYQPLPHKYNVQLYHSLQWLRKNKANLSPFETTALNQYEKLISEYGYNEQIKLDGTPIFRHFFGADKPWMRLKGVLYPIPIIENFSDFWFYASMTKFFADIKKQFVSGRLRTEGTVVADGNKESELSQDLMRNIFKYRQNKFNYIRCRLLSHISIKKKRRQHYINKKRDLRMKLRQVDSFMRGGGIKNM